MDESGKRKWRTRMIRTGVVYYRSRCRAGSSPMLSGKCRHTPPPVQRTGPCPLLHTHTPTRAFLSAATLNFSISETVLLVRKLSSSKNTKFGAKNSPLGKFRGELNFWALTISSAGNLQLSVGLPESPSFLTHDDEATCYSEVNITSW